ncbi:MAG: AFG1 family ATPase [Alphaproteobacteria bacterium]|nr:AFG1 family ATPase [Alphaproteobacteria bacterium]
MTPLELYKIRLVEGSLSTDPAQEIAMHALQRLYDDVMLPRPSGFFARFQKPVPVRGLYMHGPVGRGKTVLMDLFFAALPENIPKRRVHFHKFMITVHEYLHNARMAGKSGAGADSALLSFAREMPVDCRVLCFDEFHVTDVADAMILGRLFTALFTNGVTVVATSNWPPEKLYEGGLQRDRFLPFIDLVKQRMEVVRIAGPEDYRLRALRDAGVYFCPLGSHTTQRAAALMTRLTDALPFTPETITVKGHSFTIDVSRSVARASFAALCERPLGAADYIAIAANYPTLFLENIPKLTYDRRNEAKRLMTLIDILYEHGTQLIITADALPEQLYRGDDHAFEFQRTVSRLIEMQGADYLAKHRAA